MTSTKKPVQIFKMKNRKGFAAICDGHLTEGLTRQEAAARMQKALSRTQRLGMKNKQ